MELESSLLTRWLPWLAVVQLAALVILWRAIGRPRSGPVALVLSLTALVAAVLAAAIALRHDPSLRLALSIAYMVAVGASTAGLLAFLLSRVTMVPARQAALLLGVVMLAFYLAVLPYVRTVQPTASDEPHYLIITQSLVLDHDLDLANDYAGDRYREFYEDRLPDVHGIHVGDRIYSIRDLGLPIIAVPGFALAGRTGALVEVCLVGAYLVGLLFLLAREVGISAKGALLAAGLAGLLHPVATYTTQIEPELFAAALFSTAVYALRRGAASSPAALAVASACLGLIGIFSTRGWCIALGVGLVVAVWALRPSAPLPAGARIVRAFAAALPFGLLLLATSWGNCLMFPFGDGSGGCNFMPSAGYLLVRDQQQVLTYSPQIGLTGLLFDRTFGLLSHTPLYLLAFAGIPGFIRAFRTGRAPALVPLALGALTLVIYIASIAYWWADGAPPSRYLVASLPLLVIALGYGIDRLRELAWGRLLALGVLVPSIAVSFVFLITPNVRYDLATDIARSGLSGQLWAEFAGWFHVNPGLLFPSIVHPDGMTIALVVLWWAMAAAFVAIGLQGRLRTSGLAQPEAVPGD
jgi:hypothetical protein